MKVSIVSACFAVLTVLQCSVNARIHKESFGPFVTKRFVHNIKSFGQSAAGNQDVYRPRLTFADYRAQASDVADNDQTQFHYLSEESAEDPAQIARQFVMQQLSMNMDEDFLVKNQYKDAHNGVTHLYLKQLVNGVEVENADLNINIDRKGRIVSFGESIFTKGTGHVDSDREQIVFQNGNEEFLSETKEIDASEAVAIVAQYLELPAVDSTVAFLETHHSLQGEPQQVVKGLKISVDDSVPVSKKYLHQQTEDGRSQLLLVWDVKVEMEDNWFHAHVDAVKGEVVSLVDWVSEASYEVFPIGVNDPSEGVRSVIENPDKMASEASPLGWHAVSDSVHFTTTAGNNVFAQENLSGSSDGEEDHKRPDGGEGLNFTFPINFKKHPKTYLNAAVTNLFYWNNVMHDLFYMYGFDEQSGNFQQNNFDRGGQDGDAVVANAQDGAGYNNANFASPPDGYKPKMRMYVWNTAKPYRDGDLENGIIIHEYSHGISTRLTGGPANSGCLPFGESGGMGEGYGDFFATVLRMNKNDTKDSNFAMGSYAANSKKGIRKFVYSTDMSINPSTYAFTRKFAYIGVHAKGEVWAVMLYEVYWALVEVHGVADNLYDPVGTDENKTSGLPAGNVMSLQLVIDSMKFQPCRPSFVDARDAMFQADQVNYDGKNYCTLWTAFAKRGLGYKARSGGKEDFSVPSRCQA